MARLPKAYENFMQRHPEIWQAYDQLGGLLHDAGPLDKKHRELIKLAMAIGAGLEGGAHAHVRRALEEGVKPEAIYHVVLLAITTLGFPRSIAALTWVEEVLGKHNQSAKGKRR